MFGRRARFTGRRLRSVLFILGGVVWFTSADGIDDNAIGGALRVEEAMNPRPDAGIFSVDALRRGGGKKVYHMHISMKAFLQPMLRNELTLRMLSPDVMLPRLSTDETLAMLKSPNTHMKLATDAAERADANDNPEYVEQSAPSCVFRRLVY